MKPRAKKLVHVGFGNHVPAGRIVAIVNPDSAPVKRLKDESRESGMLVDATQGRKTRSVLVTDSGHVVLCAIQTDTIAARFEGEDVEDPEESA